MPSGEGRGRTNFMEKKRLIGRHLDHCMAPQIEIPEFMLLSFTYLQNPIYTVLLF